MKKVLAIASMVAVGHFSNAAVWDSTEVWNEDWELKYSSWFATSFKEDIFIKGKYAGTVTDCADAVYTARMIFSMENKLPFAMKDPTGSGNLITNSMTRWDAKGQSEKWRSFVDYVNLLGSTGTLPQDSYPVKVDRSQIRPGTIWSRVRQNSQNIWRRIIGGRAEGHAGHAEAVQKVSDTGVITLIGSTVPPKVRPLIVTTSLVFLPVDSSTGFRRWILPQNYGKPAAGMSGYSMEQYSLGGGHGKRSLGSFNSELQNRLALRVETVEEKIQRVAADLCSLTKSRVEAVSDGLKAKAENNNACFSKEQYGDFSTPNRDARLKAQALELVELLDARSRNEIEVIENADSALFACAIEIASNRTIPLRDFVIQLLRGEVSSNPNDGLEARWGLGSGGRNKCPQYKD